MPSRITAFQSNLKHYINYPIWDLGPSDHDKLDLYDLPVKLDEHYLVKHRTDWYECLKCRKTGQNIRDEPCTWHSSVREGHGQCDIKSKSTNQVDKTHLDDCMDEETLLEALLEEELALSQMLEEALSLSATEASPAIQHTDTNAEDEMLKEAMALSMQNLPPQQKPDQRQEVEETKVVATVDATKEITALDKEEEEDLEQALALSMQGDVSGSGPGSPEAASLLSELSSEKSKYNMQCIVNMGFSREQAIWGVKRANDGDGSIDLALQYASWKCDAEILMEKRRKLQHTIKNDLMKGSHLNPPSPRLSCFQ